LYWFVSYRIIYGFIALLHKRVDYLIICGYLMCFSGVRFNGLIVVFNGFLWVIYVTGISMWRVESLYCKITDLYCICSVKEDISYTSVCVLNGSYFSIQSVLN